MIEVWGCDRFGRFMYPAHGVGIRSYPPAECLFRGWVRWGGFGLGQVRCSSPYLFDQ